MNRTAIVAAALVLAASAAGCGGSGHQSNALDSAASSALNAVGGATCAVAQADADKLIADHLNGRPVHNLAAVLQLANREAHDTACTPGERRDLRHSVRKIERIASP